MGAIALLAVLIVCITFIVVQGKPVPQEFSIIITALTGAMTGFLIGTRTITPDMAAEIRSKEPTKQEAAETEKIEEKRNVKP